MRRPSARTMFRAVCIYVVLSAFVGLFWLASLYPVLPTGPAQWGILFLLGLPAYLLLEWLGDLLWNTRLTQIVDARTAGRRFSLLRVAYGLVIVLATLFLLFAAGFLVKTSPG